MEPAASILGKLGELPFEIRTNIYEHALYIGPIYPSKPTSTSMGVFYQPSNPDTSVLGLLCTNHTIYTEALPYLYRSNDFSLILRAATDRWVTSDPQGEAERPFELSIAQGRWLSAPMNNKLIRNVRWDMLHHIRHLALSVCVDGSATDQDYRRLIPKTAVKKPGMWQAQTLSLMDVMDMACALIASCYVLDKLHVDIMCPSGFEPAIRALVNPLLTIRACKHVDVLMGSYMVTASSKYRAYLEGVLRMGRGAPTPKHAPLSHWRTIS
ncbi:hypothetical protein BP6252_08357 [Coleophoma cylindrospora]|uniref:Uncharacterized protein n=1 Tax=Coleophoma cylindrospora TaxID=1849047 RepID=A0A3D8R5R2_9HELO|nr:hypothetical protein BP6252_08357 [Coleophoma cylindrospora]